MSSVAALFTAFSCRLGNWWIGSSALADKLGKNLTWDNLKAQVNALRQNKSEGTGWSGTLIATLLSIQIMGDTCIIQQWGGVLTKGLIGLAGIEIKEAVFNSGLTLLSKCFEPIRLMLSKARSLEYSLSSLAEHVTRLMEWYEQLMSLIAATPRLQQLVGAIDFTELQHQLLQRSPQTVQSVLSWVQRGLSAVWNFIVSCMSSIVECVRDRLKTDLLVYVIHVTYVLEEFSICCNASISSLSSTISRLIPHSLPITMNVA